MHDYQYFDIYANATSISNQDFIRCITMFVYQSHKNFSIDDDNRILDYKLTTWFEVVNASQIFFQTSNEIGLAQTLFCVLKK